MKRIITILLSLSISFATIIHIPADQPTIQMGINSTTSGDTVLVYPGTYFEHLVIQSNLTLASLYLIENDTTFISQTILDGSNLHPVLDVLSGCDSTTVVQGFTITHGQGGFGAGIVTIASSPQISQMVIRDNHAQYGGGVYCFGSESEPKFRQVQILQNTAEQGGGIYVDLSTLTLEQSIVVENVAEYHGGGICTQGSTVSLLLDLVHINGNSAEYSGGGIHIGHGGEAWIHRSKLNQNSAIHSQGGGICTEESTLVITSSEITQNSSDNGGGGIALSFSELTLLNSQLQSNSAGAFGGGGGILLWISQATLKNTILRDNVAGMMDFENGASSGGAIGLVVGTAVLTNCTIIDNSSEYVAGLDCYSGNYQLINTILWHNSPWNMSSIITDHDYCEIMVKHSLIENGIASMNLDLEEGDQLNWLEGNLEIDPLLVDHETAPVPSAFSPVVDSGTPDTTGLGLPELDMLGLPRMIDGNTDGWAVIDMGATEFQLATGDLNEDGQLDVLDVIHLINCIIEINEDNCFQGDLNTDGINNVLDIILLVNIIMEN